MFGNSPERLLLAHMMMTILGRKRNSLHEQQHKSRRTPLKVALIHGLQIIAPDTEQHPDNHKNIILQLVMLALEPLKTRNNETILIDSYWKEKLRLQR